jgi:putative transposase
VPRPVNQVWLTDVTEHRADEGKLYLCAIKDVYSNRIVGYSIDSRMKASLAVAALDHAIATRSPVDRFNLVDFAHGSSYIHCRTMGYADQWVPWERAARTLPWSRSSLCCSATSWTELLHTPVASQL